MKSSKVLQISVQGLGNGGVQAVFMGIVRNLYKEMEFDVLVFTRELRFYDEEFLRYGKIHRIPCDHTGNSISDILELIRRPFKIFFKTYFILKKGNYTAIHCHKDYESGLPLLAARLARVPIRIVHAHNKPIPRKRVLPIRAYRWIMRRLIKNNSTARVGCSRQACEFLFGENKQESIVINNALDLQRFDNSKYLSVSNLNMNIQFIHVGRFCDQKNQQFLLDVFFIIHQEFLNSRLNLVGFGEDEGLLKEKIKNLGLDNVVNLLPHDSDIPKLLSESHYMIFPSNYEGLGIALLEAQAMGVRCFPSMAVPPEADMGNCVYYSLDLGARQWGQMIIEYIKKYGTEKSYIPKEILNQYNISEIVKKYADLYERGYVSG